MGSQRAGHDWATLTFAFSRRLHADFTVAAPGCAPSSGVLCVLARIPSFAFSRRLHADFTVAAPGCAPSSGVLCVLASIPHLPPFWGRPLQQEWGDTALWFWFVFPWRLVTLSTFHLPVGHLCVWLRKASIHALTGLFFALCGTSSLHFLTLSSY